MKFLANFLFQQKYVVLSFLATLLATFPLFHPGLIPTHDGEYHLIRFYEFDKMIRTGNVYPRWAPDLFFGYGIPLLTYVYPLPNYMASLFHLFGVSFLDSVKLNMAAASLVGAILFYLWAKKFWGNPGGMISSIFYTFSPYHFVDIFVRGSVGEVWALGLFPGFLWSYTEFVDQRKSLYFILSVLFLSFTVFSHNILGLMFFFFAITYMVLLFFTRKKTKNSVWYAMSILFLSVGISAIFWLPALMETKYVTGLQVYDIIHNFPDISQLLFPSWGTDFFGSGTGNEMSVQIGVMNILILFISIFCAGIFWKKKNKRVAVTVGFFVVWVILTIFLMNPSSYFLWNVIPLIHYFQFPWRLLSVTILACSFLAGSLVVGKKTAILAWIFAFLAIVATISYTTPAYYMLRSDTYYVTRSNFIDSTNSVGNIFNTIWNTSKNQHSQNLFIATKNVNITNLKKYSPTNITATIKATNNTKQILALSYFPGWHVLIDNKPVIVLEQKGLLAFNLPVGTHTLSISLIQTPLENIATGITVASCISLLAFFLLRKRFL